MHKLKEPILGPVWRAEWETLKLYSPHTKAVLLGKAVAVSPRTSAARQLSINTTMLLQRIIN